MLHHGASMGGEQAVDVWTSPWGDRIALRPTSGTLWCDPLVGQLLDATAPLPSREHRPGRHYLLDIDGRDHIVLVASRTARDDAALPIGLARCVRVPGTRIGVPSLVVRVDLRGRGIATRMVKALGAFAHARGIEGFRIRVSAPDSATMHLLRRIGVHPAAVVHGVQSTIDVPLGDAERWPVRPLGVPDARECPAR